MITAFDGARWLAVWQDTRGGTDDVYAMRFNAAGHPLDAAVLPVATGAGNQRDPTVVFDGQSFVVAWIHFDTDLGSEWDGGELRVARIGTDGALLDPAGIVVPSDGIGQLRPMLEPEPDGVLVRSAGQRVRRLGYARTFPWSGTHHVVVFERHGPAGGAILASRVAPDGTAAAPKAATAARRNCASRGSVPQPRRNARARNGGGGSPHWAEQRFRRPTDANAAHGSHTPNRGNARMNSPSLVADLTSVRRVVLDTNYLRNIIELELHALLKRGLVLSVSSSALGELWGRAQRERKPGLLLAAVRRVASFVDPDQPLLMGANWIRDEAAAESAAKRAALVLQHQAAAKDMFARALSGGDDFESYGALLNEKIDTRGRGFVEVVHEWSSNDWPLLSHMTEPELIVEFQGWIAQNTQCPADRCDAWLQVVGRIAAAAIKRTQRKPPTENDVEDYATLALLSAPAFILTRDLNLIERVDETLSYQRPWIRTFGELLTDELPRGLPWGENAQRIAETFRRRSRAELRALDERIRSGLQ